MRVWWVLGLVGVVAKDRNSRGAGNVGYSYNLGPGSYASFNFPQPGVTHTPINHQHNLVPNSIHSGNALLPPSSVQTSFLQSNHLGSVKPVPIFLNTLAPILSANVQPHTPPLLPVQPIQLHPLSLLPVHSPTIQPQHPTFIPVQSPPVQSHHQSLVPVHSPPLEHHHLPPIPVHSSPIQPHQPPLLPVRSPPLTMSKPISLHNYQLSPPVPAGHAHTFVSFGSAHQRPGQGFQTNFIDHPHSINHPQNVFIPSIPSTFIPSRPDLVPPHLHPAHHPVPNLPPQPFPIYSPTPPTLQPVEPTNQYDPFEFSKTNDPDESVPLPNSPNRPNSPVVLINPPIPPPLFPIATLSPLPLPGPPPLFPQYDAFPQYDDPSNLLDFPEYDAVPPNFPFSRLILRSRSHKNQKKQPIKQNLRQSNRLDQSSSEFLFTASQNLRFPNAERLKRKNLKHSKMINSHGGPVNILDISEMCGKTVDEDDINLLNAKFTACKGLLGPCGLNHTNNTAVTQYGTCLNSNYPETVTLNLGRTLSSGHGSVSFHSDRDCTNFVHQFFPSCGKYLLTCSQVEQDRRAAALILGCLFGQYPSLMVPLLTVEQDLSEEV